jgi:serine/threonine protein kinase
MFTTEPDAPCSRCLLRLADASAAPPAQLADYAIICELGHGAMGTVYLAEQAVPRKLVALKVLSEEIADERVLHWFADEIETLGRLEHPHIVPIYDGKGLHHTPPFFAMRWIDGSTLAAPANRERFKAPKEAARLLIKIAGAVQFAHERGVLHRDLKPSNILVDGAGEPYVSDFGLARALNGETASSPGAGAGSLGFMSPEQATAIDAELTVATDVYGLGALLYDLLTGLPARRPRDLTHLIELFKTEEALDPRAHAPELPLDLARVCLCALERSPKQRYRSAAELSDDLQRVLEAKPPEPRNAAQPTEFRKALYWARRHRILMLLAITLAMSVLFIPVLPNFVEADLAEQTIKQNAAIAEAQAASVILELQSRRDRAAAMAHDPEVAKLVDWTNVYDPPHSLARHASGFDLLTVFKPDGTLVARYPKPTIRRYKTLDYSYRDYFAGQRAIELSSRDPVYISRAFFSTGDQTLQFGFSAPIFDAEGARTGAVMLGVTARETFGAVRMDPGGGSTALLGPRDREGKEQSFPPTLNVLAAPGLALGVDKPVDPELSKQICAELNCIPHRQNQLRPLTPAKIMKRPDYFDPMTGAWSIAALAPVGETGIIVVVATPHAFIDQIAQRMSYTFMRHSWIPLLVGFLITVLLVRVPDIGERLRRRRSALKR